ncbi:nuclear transport factor 2 family protein [Segnochrobactrum spirostomi]|uniref:Nuclear transport factor 2 family protein n=1 Tax=Segnochrobactrum spirostomi TaxID=2608987 RepID=A0A6A7Y9A4_9HYPH|nr:nuclear transport factor 2 family protein [Segnochrobactrum spirostomi]MQT15325.1 nuclear transport factor 2 family protein [Segnochrobactrum spirostomi]
MSDSVVKMLEAFSAAWNAHDLDTLMALSTDDCEFWASAGPDELGTRYVGQQAVAGAYRALFDFYPDAQWTKGRLTLLGPDRALSEWTFVGTTLDGKRVEVLGLDVLDLVGEKVRIKNSYRKNRTA